VLSWTSNVPWTNTIYTIFRKNIQTGIFDSIGTSTTTFYTDRGLINGETYCYKIRSKGSYSLPGFIDPIMNDSQISCGIPEDNIPPCPPELTVATLCDLSSNTLTWRNPVSDTCDYDIARYIIHFATGTGVLSPIDSVGPGDTSYVHTPSGTFTGCYSVVAVDSTGNRSDFSNKVCIDLDACPDFLYRLPNVFTPNGDKYNEKFRPFPFRSVNSVKMEFWDRWGRMVFKTEDPEINWDGTDITTGKPCSDGTYYYAGEVYEQTLDGNIPRQLHGSLTLLR
jgi:gliding motility-associated-like protein